MNLQRMKQLAGIKLNESVAAVPGIGNEMQEAREQKYFSIFGLDPSTGIYFHEFDADSKEDAQEEVRSLRDQGFKPVVLRVAKDQARWHEIDTDQYVKQALAAKKGIGEQSEFDTYPGQPKPSYEGKSREELESQLAKLQTEFDPGFEYSDDHSFWKRQTAIKKHIAAIEQALAGLNEDESDMQTAATVASNQADIGFDMAQGGVTESDDEITDEMVRQAYEQRHRAFATGAANRYALADRASALANQFAQQQSMQNHGRGFDPISGNLLPKNEQNGQSLDEKSSSEKQARFMAAAAHNPEFAKKAGISGDVAREFNKADTGTRQLSNAMKDKTAEGYKVMPGIDRDRYQERPGLEGPFTASNGKVVYYDPAEGAYYDPDSDFYMDRDFTLDEDLQNGYGTEQYANGEDYFPNGADSPVVRSTGPSGAKQGDNPEQKRMQVAEAHRDLVYAYRSFLKESTNTKKKIV